MQHHNFGIADVHILEGFMIKNASHHRQMRVYTERK